MRPIFGKKSPMSVTALTRSAAQALVEREERTTGSRMVAYVNVASMVGVSAEWLRKFVKQHGEAKSPDLEVGFNIMAVYDRVVSRIDANTQKVAAENAALRKQIHAVVPRSLGQHLGTANQIGPEGSALVDET